jgi:hypothetical protein
MKKTGFFTKIVFCCVTLQSKWMVIKPRNVYKTGIKSGRDEHLKYNKSKVTQIYKDLAQSIK